MLLNTMKLKIFLTTCLIGISAIMTGCRDWLDQLPMNTVTEDQAWKTAADAEGAVAKAFAIFRRALAGLTKADTPATTRNGAWGDHFFWGDMRSDDWITPNNDSDWQAIIENRLLSRTELEPLTNWRLFYRSIEQCNLVLENVPNIEEGFTGNRKAELLAEARFMRALAHFYASRVWGDVPVNLKARNVEPIGREPLKSVMQMVVDEIDQAVPDLPWEFPGNPRVSTSRGNKGAALAMKAHALMWLGEYEKASATISEIIASGKFGLIPIERFRDMFDRGETEEIIFQVYYNAALGEYSDYYGHIMTYYLTNPYTSRTNLTISMPRSKVLEIYPDWVRDQSDKRVPEFFESIDFSVSSNELRPILPDPLANGERQIMFAKFRKKKDMTYNLMDAPIIIFRYADLLLLKAEADAWTNRLEESLQGLNLVKARAGIPLFEKADQPLLLEEILEERRRELTGESQRVYDLVRLGRLHDYNPLVTIQGEKDGAGFYPVSDEAFANNPNMTQTYYWQFNQ